MPSGSVTLIVGFSSPTEISHPSGGPWEATRARSFVAGPHDRHAVAESKGSQHGVQVDLMPIGAYALLGVPLRGLANRVAGLEELLGDPALELEQRLYDAPRWEARFELLDSVIAARLARGRRPAPAVVHAWRRLVETGGALSISAFARELGATRQYLAAGFAEGVGLAPKRLATVLRFQRACRLLERPGRPDYAAIVRTCGYYDQPHLNREFHRFTGISPGEFLARRTPDGAGVIAPA